MARLTITNLAAADWQVVIEDRVNLMLGSTMLNIRRIDIEFACHGLVDDKFRTHSCTVVVTEPSGAQLYLRNEQADANEAIDGAVARVRRAVARRMRARLPRQRHTSAW
jgi:ribosome-associated translation inhibitor RaiA